MVQARASHRQRRLMLVLQRVVEARRASPRLVLVLLGIALVSAPARGSLVLVLLCASPQQQLLLPLHRVVEAVVEAAHRVVEASHRLMLLLLAAPGGLVCRSNLQLGDLSDMLDSATTVVYS